MQATADNTRGKGKPIELVIEIVKDLRRNVDEAEQFEAYINLLIENCALNTLVFIAKQLAESVRDNMETPYLRYNLNDTMEDLEILLKKVEELEYNYEEFN